MQKSKPFFENSNLSILPLHKFSSTALNPKSLRINSFKKSELSFRKSKKSDMQLNKFDIYEINKNPKSKTIEENMQIRDIIYRRNKNNKKIVLISLNILNYIIFFLYVLSKIEKMRIFYIRLKIVYAKLFLWKIFWKLLKYQIMFYSKMR